jgi:hypothetical protein
LEADAQSAWKGMPKRTEAVERIMAGRGAKRKTCGDDQGERVRVQGEGEKGRSGEGEKWREKLTFLGAFEENALPM